MVDARRQLEIIGGVAAGIAAIVLGLWGLFAAGYGGDFEGSDPYVTIAGRRYDATGVGVAALAAAFVLLGLAVRLLRRPRSA